MTNAKFTMSATHFFSFDNSTRSIRVILLCAVLSPMLLRAADPNFVDLRTVMRLAGANNDEIELARVKHLEAIAESKQAWQRFWPAFTLGAAYRGHEGRVQDIAGEVFDARKHQYTVGGTVLLDWSPGDLYYQALAAKQRAEAAGRLAEATRQDIVLEAVLRYYDLLAAEADIAIIGDDLRVVEDYGKQLEGAVAAGTAFKADLLRVRTQISRSRLLLRKQEEVRDVRAALLAETLRLTPDSALRPAKADLVPVTLIHPETGTGSMVQLALKTRAEIAAADAFGGAALTEEKRSRVAPLVPSVQGGYVAGGLGGGFAGDWGNFGDTQDFYIGLGWKIGPGGLFDRQRRRIAEAQSQQAALRSQNIRAAVAREVVEEQARVVSARDQIKLSDEAVGMAEEMAGLAKERQASQIGVVLEFLLAQEELTLAKRDRFQAVSAHNASQHRLFRALGGVSGAGK
jgi:outer membrane protein TolC